MKLFTFNPKDGQPRYQTWREFLYNIDARLNNTINYINLFCPNYLVLNLIYSGYNVEASDIHPYYKTTENRALLTYYTNDELFNDNDGTITPYIYTQTIGGVLCTIINAYHLRAHQGIVNNYGDNTYIKYSPSQPDENLVKIPAGYVIFSKAQIEVNMDNLTIRALRSTEQSPIFYYDLQSVYDEPPTPENLYAEGQDISYSFMDSLYNPDNYLIHAMGASGTFYLLNKWSPTAEWIYYTNATDVFGSSIYITIANVDVRWFTTTIISQTWQKKWHLKNISSVSQSVVVKNTINNPNIISKTRSIWERQYLLDYEIYLGTSGGTWLATPYYEEVICDSRATSHNTPEEGVMTQYHTINTNIPSNTLTLYVNYY